MQDYISSENTVPANVIPFSPRQKFTKVSAKHATSISRV
jgi:hypothetical protein